MRRGYCGRYGSIPSGQWSRYPAALCPHARLVHQNLQSGGWGNLAGVGFINHEMWLRESGLTTAELEKARYITRDTRVLWVINALRDAPRVLDDRHQFVSDLYRKGVRRIIGGLPSDSEVVKKFKRRYGLAAC